MTKFNPKNKETPTIGDLLDPIFTIVDKLDALQYKRAYLEYVRKRMTEDEEDSRHTSEEVVDLNIGYYAGYGTHEQRALIEDLFEVEHPVFGSVKENGFPSTTEAFECGIENVTLKELRDENKTRTQLS